MTTSTQPKQNLSSEHSFLGERLNWMQRLVGDARLHIVVLLTLVWTCFGRTLSSYFLADDFAEVHYVSRIFNGAPQLLWANFSGPYMQNASLRVFRPWMLMTQVFDFLIWKGNSVGFYLSNLLYFSGVVILLYVVVRQLTSNWGSWRSSLTALFSAALFASSPLHCESVSWVVGRVDVDCCFYYLLSLHLLLRGRQAKSGLYSALGVIAFWLALLTKEMAVGLPIVVTSIGFLWTAGKVGFSARCQEALKLSKPLWVSLIAYFGIRYIALGTILGGYTGAIGAAQSAGALQRWLDPDTVTRLFFPLSAAIFPAHNPYASILSGCYLLLCAIISCRLIASDLSSKWLILLSIWVIASIVPIYRLWGLGVNLEGARFYFFLSLVLSIAWPAMLFEPRQSVSDIGNSLGHKFIAAGTGALLLMIATQYRAAYATNLLWVHAGKEVHALCQQCERLALSTPANQKLLLLGIPEDHGGAHQILNGCTFAMMLSPPFIEKSIADRFPVFNPLLYGSGELINTSRLKQCLAVGNIPLLWNSRDQKFLRLDLAYKSGPSSDENQTVAIDGGSQWYPFTSGHALFHQHNAVTELDNIEEGDGLRIDGLHLHPLKVDFLEFDLRCASPAPEMKVGWNDQAALSCRRTLASKPEISLDGGFQHVRIRLSRWWRWFTTGPIQSMNLQFSPCDKLEIRNLEFTSAEHLVPQLTINGIKPSSSGVYPVSGSGLQISFDASKIPDAKNLLVEISRPNFFFDNTDGTDLTTVLSQAFTTTSAAGTLHLGQENFPALGFYQVRARCVGLRGQPLAEYSDVLNIER